MPSSTSNKQMIKMVKVILGALVSVEIIILNNHIFFSEAEKIAKLIFLLLLQNWQLTKLFPKYFTR